jgi:tRNA dimethylallyltransferase
MPVLPFAPGPDELLVVVGPTASGKTALAIDLARQLDGEIIGVDSVQVYRHFDLGSGKPTASERAAAPHHLVDFADPLDPLDAGRFAALARTAIDEIRGRGKRVILCGGAFLWVKAILFGMVEAAPASPEIRERHRQEAEAEGRPALHARLALVDPVCAARLNPNDLIRVSRALEVFELTGRKLSDLHAEHQQQAPRHAFRLVGLRRSPEEMSARISARTAGWIERGWVAEVERLVALGHGGTRAMSSVGYWQVHEHLAGRLPAAELAPAIDQATRIFVRRQRTWLRDEPVAWLDP